jgi:hypothetical protein
MFRKILRRNVRKFFIDVFGFRKENHDSGKLFYNFIASK